MNIGSVDLLVLALCAVLLLIMIAGSFRLKVPRKVSLQGIEDPKAAEAYDRISRMPQFGLIRQSFVKKLKKYVVEGSITDVGCGPGYLLQLISKEISGHKLVGVDISEEMVERAKTNFKSAGLNGRVEFKKCSADHLPFDEGTQDFIVSTLSLHHWADPQSSFNEIYSVLKPNGQMLILDLRRDARRLLLWIIWFVQNVSLRVIGADVLRKLNEPTGSLLASYTDQEIRDIMSRTRFKEYKIEGKLGWIYIWGKKV
jgi:ubiquinone/menaquinone biosynthesis C-methylase UbiE